MKKIISICIALFVIFIGATSITCPASDIVEPSVAGMFYPQNPKELKGMVERFLAGASVDEVEGDIVAMIVPHAGYIYSGPVAAYGYKAIKDKKIDTAVIIGLSHRVPFDGTAVYTGGAFRTPLGDVPVDTELADE